VVYRDHPRHLYLRDQPRDVRDPSSQDFGTVNVGSFADRTFTVQKTGGSTLTGTAATPYSIVSGGSFTLGPGATQGTVVRFAPTAGGTFVGTVNFTPNGGNFTATATGVGVVLPLTLQTLTANTFAPPAGGRHHHLHRYRHRRHRPLPDQVIPDDEQLADLERPAGLDHDHQLRLDPHHPPRQLPGGALGPERGQQRRRRRERGGARAALRHHALTRGRPASGVDLEGSPGVDLGWALLIVNVLLGGPHRWGSPLDGKGGA